MSSSRRCAERGFELSAGKPQVILKTIDGVVCEPMERVTVDCPNGAVGAVIELLGSRKAEMHHMEQMGASTRLEFNAPSRGLIGLPHPPADSDTGRGDPAPCL